MQFITSQRTKTATVKKKAIESEKCFLCSTSEFSLFLLFKSKLNHHHIVALTNISCDLIKHLKKIFVKFSLLIENFSEIF